MKASQDDGKGCMVKYLLFAFMRCCVRVLVGGLIFWSKDSACLTILPRFGKSIARTQFPSILQQPDGSPSNLQQPTTLDASTGVSGCAARTWKVSKAIHRYKQRGVLQARPWPRSSKRSDLTPFSEERSDWFVQPFLGFCFNNLEFGIVLIQPSNERLFAVLSSGFD